MGVERATEQDEVTRLLVAARAGDESAMEQVIPLVYDDLRVLAKRQLARERGARTLRPSDLVHEAYIKLADSAPKEATDRPHFLAIAARAMRQVLVDHARKRRTAKRGEGWQRATLSDRSWVADFEPHELLALNEALERLEPRQRKIVECRFFAGMEEREIAEAVGVSERTVRREWVKAREWLYHRMYGGPPS